ncbi:MAG: tetratricopeptide repeat-containing glycosyltransferase family protein [Thermodesulfovibrionales bacterium]|nr:tetratricopeptide repeat-containing glycosyltransferase family protein [Thermodesulfovibrionales bacterium]
MPTSPYAHVGFVSAIFSGLRPKSILDVGIGFGKMGFIARDVLDVMYNERYKKEDWRVVIDGIEIFEPYIQEHQRFLYNNIYIGDAFEVIDRLGTYDLIIIGDVLEHLEKKKGWLFLDKCCLHCNTAILINIPLGETQQGAIYNNEFETHLSYWYEEELTPLAAFKHIITLSNGMPYGVFLIDKNRFLAERIKQLAFIAIEMQQKGDIDNAIDTFRYINTLKPDIPDCHLNIGTLLAQKGNHDDALKYLKKALELNPKSSIAHYNIAKVYKEKKAYNDAINHYIEALTLNPLDPEPAYNLGNLYAELDRYDEAIVSYQIAIKTQPNHTKALNNLGAVRHILCQLDEAICCYDKVIQIDPTNADAYYNKSLSLLLKGEFQEGWKLYEWRFKRQDYPPRTYPMQIWDGTTFRGTILIYAEQGLGDTIHFVRYLKPLSQKGLEVYLHCHDELVSLIKEGVEGVSDVIPFSNDHQRYDFYFPLMSLPRVFKTDINSIPSEVPYIKPHQRQILKWQEVVSNHECFKIGLVWTGKPEHKYTRMRSFSLETLEPLFDIKGIKFFSLQKGDARKEALKYGFIKDYTNRIMDFSDTAGLINNLDLIISVDTSVAHLAGAMAKPVWILLPFSPDWRWLLNRDDTPWYKTARLFRQERLGDWGTVILKIKQELQKLLSYQKVS